MIECLGVVGWTFAATPVMNVTTTMSSSATRTATATMSSVSAATSTVIVKPTGNSQSAATGATIPAFLLASMMIIASL